MVLAKMFTNSPAIWAAAFCLLMTALHLATIAIASLCCRIRPQPVPVPTHPLPVSLIRPVCGLDNFVCETLASTFELDYPDYEIIFCAARPDDPVVRLVQRLMDDHPQVQARMLVGDDKMSSNPKLNNCVKGWKAARHDWIVMADSNVLMPADFVQRLLAVWRSDTGLVCSTPIGARPQGFWADLECAFLNTFQAKWQYASESIGLGFAQGKTMMWRREVLEKAGGIRALAAEIAEDAAATKLVRSAGLHVQLVSNSFEQPLGYRRASEVWARQVRWARLRRATFPLVFIPEAIAGSAVPIIAGAYAAFHSQVNVFAVIAGLAVVWFGAEAILARVAGWHLSWATPAALLVRDLLLPVLWIDAWLADDFIWRGNEMTVGLGASGQEDPSRSG